MEEFPLSHATAEAAAPLPLVEEILYRQDGLDERGFNRLVQKVAIPTLTIYRPEHPAHRGATIIICPGGGYKYLVIDREGHAIARYLQAQGITAVVLKYRLPEPNQDGAALPRPQQDALAALRYIRKNAAQWGLDSARVGILGCSAGGHLAGSAALLGQVADGSRPDFVVLLYPLVSLETPYPNTASRERLLGIGATPERFSEFSLERHVRPELPPFFLVHARDDKTVPAAGSELLATALKAQRVPAEFLLVASGGHGFALGRDEESSRWKKAFLAWLDRLP